MAATGDRHATELELRAETPRARAGRLASLGLLIVLLVAVVVAGRAALAEGAPQPVAVRSTSGQASTTKVIETTLPRRTAPVIHRLRQAVEQVTSTTATPTTTTTTTAPPTTTSTTTTTVPATTTTPRPPPPPTTTTTAPPAPTTPAPAAGRTQSGQATWYRWKAGNCAHNTLPKGTRVTVTNTANGARATCIVGDRGAFGPPTIIDLDATVFEQIAPLGAGRINVVISW